jgi:DNA-binding transcriptional LysR family regulator
MRDAVVAGLAIALLPTFFLKDPLRKRTLRVIDVGAEPEGATIFVAYPQDLREDSRVDGLVAERFRRSAYWDKLPTSRPGPGPPDCACGL